MSGRNPERGELTIEQSVRVLRAVAAKLENQADVEGLGVLTFLIADVALIADILADFMDRFDGETTLTEARKSFLEGFNEGRPDA